MATSVANYFRGNFDPQKFALPRRSLLNGDDIAAMTLEQLVKLDRVQLAQLPEDAAALRMTRLRGFVLDRLDASYSTGLTVCPVGEVWQMIGIDPRTIPGIQVTTGAPSLPATDPYTRMATGSAGSPLLSQYVNASDLRAWVSTAPWDALNDDQLRPAHINGAPVVAWNHAVGWPA